MKLKWKADFIRRYEFSAPGIKSKIHFKKGMTIVVPEGFEKLYLKKLSDPIASGYIEVLK